jgi:17beta-estradiol 17-dehydrogenase / very-long-chain 3-oxoacyl-CoA reductase
MDMGRANTFLNHAVELGYSYPCGGMILAIVSAIGLFKVITMTLSYFAIIADVFILPRPSLAKYGAKPGSPRAWAVVTGATAGIGEQFSHQLAQNGFNLAIVSRSETKLQQFRTQLEDKYKIKVEYLAFDAAKDDPDSYARLGEFVKDLDVSVLVNNVGVSHEMPVSFLETSDQELRDIIIINNMATLKITQTVLPRMIATVDKKTVKRGLVLTMGSFAGLVPTPLLATYSGSKAFLNGWSSAMARELVDQNIDVQLILSHLVTSNMSKIRRSSALVPTAKVFVRSVFQSIGRRSGAQERYAVSTPYWSHALMHWWMDNTFGVFSKLFVNINYNMHVDIRRRVLRKREREAKQK